MQLHKLNTYNMYIAPELYDNSIDDVLSKVCDFWSFGAVMYELLSGEVSI